MLLYTDGCHRAHPGIRLPCISDTQTQTVRCGGSAESTFRSGHPPDLKTLKRAVGSMTVSHGRLQLRLATGPAIRSVLSPLQFRFPPLATRARMRPPTLQRGRGERNRSTSFTSSYHCLPSHFTLATMTIFL